MNERRLNEDSVFSGMTARQARGMVGRILESKEKDELFELKRRGDIAEFIEEQAMNPGNSLEERILCVDKVLKMQGLNLDWQKLQVQVELAVAKGEGGDDEKKEQQVILILPSNGSEVAAQKNDPG